MSISVTIQQRLSYNEAVALLRSGGALVFPTETLYGLGGIATDEKTALRVRAIKGRPSHKPLPLIIGHMDQLQLLTINPGRDVLNLAAVFWPGPLTLLLPAIPGLPAGIVGDDGAVAVRLTGNELARRLCLGAGAPLIATSANFSGQEPAAGLEQIQEGLLRQVDGVLNGPPWPVGGHSSTIIRPLGGKRLAVIREGAVPLALIEAAGFSFSEV